MSEKRSGSGPDETVTGSWASESLPLSVRKELLERELRRMGLRRAESHWGASAAGGTSSQQVAHGSEHPQAGASETHGD